MESMNGLGFMRRSSTTPLSSSSSSNTKMDFAKLQSRSFVPPHRTQLPPRYHLSLNASSGTAHSLRQSWQRRVWGVIALAFVFLGIFYTFRLLGGVRQPQPRGHAIVIDAGSTGSRLHIFSYKVQNSLPHIDTQDLPSLKTKPGLSSFSSDPSKAGESLIELLEFANSKIAKADRGRTRLYLMATAGLRRLEQSVQDQILESCRLVLRKSDFLFVDGWASVISGVDEGVFAWVAANYALGTLGGDPHETTGIVELGGASAQVTFVPDSSPPPEFLYTLEFGGVSYKLYTYSFLHFGQEAAWDTLFKLLISGTVNPVTSASGAGVVVDPCTPAGYVMSPELLERYTLNLLEPNQLQVSTVLSAGNFSQCRRAALELLQKGHDQCLHARCAIGSTFVPDLRGKFFATENFFYTSQFFGLPATTSLAEVESAGNFYCGEQWTKLREKHSGMPEEDLLKYCFSTAYIVALLHDRLGIAMQDERVRFTNKVGSVPLDWAMGALIVRLSENLQVHSEWSFGDDWTILSFFGSLGLVLVIVWLIVRCRRPRLKTIYDLEKGRYITTTRLSR